MNLSELKTNDSGIIIKVKGRGAFRKRITEMGFVKGKQVTVIKNAPLRDPIEYKIMGYEVSLRKTEASLIEVLTQTDDNIKLENEYQGVFTDTSLISKACERSRTINVALVGNPNCGKTTLFNSASGSKEHVGNYGGVTVDFKKATFHHKGYTFNITDLPGTYSLTAYSPEELYVRNHILNDTPDIIINVLDASNLERNMYLTTQLIDMDMKVVIALNMFDELQKKGDLFAYRTLGRMIGIPFVPTIGSKGKGLNDLFDKVIEAYEDNAPSLRHIHINYGKCIEKAVINVQTLIKDKKNYWLTDKISSRFISLKLLEKDKDLEKIIRRCENYSQIKEITNSSIDKIESHLNEDSETALTDARYGFISGALKETYKEGNNQDKKKKTELIDSLLTSQFFGYPIFIFFMWLMFQTTFVLGQYPMDWIDNAIQFLSNIMRNNMPAGMLKDLIVDGIIGGVGSVIVFLPNILILFFFISFMEDTGYMARVAFIMDKIMHKIGLHGKSFIPMLMGFGCNVPAIMSTRTLENKNDRILTILINPFMSCSARLPVYLIIIAAVFPEKAGTVLFGIYTTGIVIAAIVAIIFKKLLFKSKEAPFVMELPPYRTPSLKTTTIHMWNKGQQYVKKMGGIILIASILIWALGYFPRETDISDNIEIQINTLKAAHNNNSISNFSENSKSKNLKSEINRKLDSLNLVEERYRQENSYIGRTGKFIQPILAPLGFDWKMSVSIVTGIAAKEVVVSTLGVLYHADENQNDEAESLINILKKEKYKSGINEGKLVYNPISAISFLIFILIYFPCIAVIAAVKNETGHWKWAVFMMTYTTILAWILSFAVYQIGNLIY
ncbi:MAG: ferrous iron transport protein B [Bacteroidales bacterium]|nr:ferrous iron transport protein B [Bacteroidales bacterium]